MAFVNLTLATGFSGKEMPRYTYSAVDHANTVVDGEVLADTELAALDQLGRKGLTPLSIEEGGQSGPWWSRDITLFGATGKLPLEVQGQFFQMFATMLSSQFGLPRALAFCHEQAKDGRLKRTLETVSSEVAGGSTLADAMEEVGTFDPRFSIMIRLGETSNRLNLVTSDIRTMLSAELRNRRQLRQALVYPMLLLMMSLAVLLMLVFFLAPTLVPVFTSANIPPPRLLSALNSIGAWLAENWITFAIGLSIAGLTFIILRQRLLGLLGTVLAKLPGIRPVVIGRRSLAFCQTLRLMLSSGARLPVALATAADMTQDPNWQSDLLTVKAAVEAGGLLSNAIADTPHLTSAAKAFLNAGEESDQMDNMLQQACLVLEEDVTNRINAALRLLTPILTLVIGLSVAFLIFSTISAILDLNDIAG